MAWLSGEDDEDSGQLEDVDVPVLPSIEDNEDTGKDDKEDVANKKVDE